MTEEQTTLADGRPTANASAPNVLIRYAGFWRRFVAFVVDLLLLGTLGQLLGLFFARQFAELGQAGRLVGVVIAAAYLIPSHRLWGRTLGMRLLGTRVQNLDGERLTWASASIRYVALAVPWFANGLVFTGGGVPWGVLIVAAVVFGSVLFIGLLGNAYLLIFNRPTRRLIHDLLAGTVVVRADAVPGRADPHEVRLRPVHTAIVALIPVAILAVVAWLWVRLAVSERQMAELVHAQAALTQMPNVLQGTLVDQQRFSPGGKSHTVDVTLWVIRWDESENRTLRRQAVAVVLQEYPRSQHVDGISVQVTWGYDIGIASLWRRFGEVRTVNEWQAMLGAGART